MENNQSILADSCVEKVASQPWFYLFRCSFTVLAAVIIFFGVIRWRLLNLPLERDEGEYAYAGQLLLQGIPPYRLAYNMKLPGTYAAYAAILAIFGHTTAGIHVGLLFVNAVCVVLLFAIAARLFGDLAGTIAGTSYALLSTHESVLGFAAHATHFVVLAALSGLILLLRAEETRRTPFFFWSGTAFGVAYMMKQPGIFLAAFAFLYLAVRCWPTKCEWLSYAKKMGIFLLAVTLPFLVTCALLSEAGVFRSFWFWTFSYARQYVTEVPVHTGWQNLKDNFLNVRRGAPELWAIALLGVYTVFRNATFRRHALFVIGLLVFSFAAVCPGLYFRKHYFILMLPAVAILIAIAIVAPVQLLARQFSSRWIQAVPVIVFVVTWVLPIHRNYGFYFNLTPIQACQLSYPNEPFVEAVSIAKYLGEHTAPTGRIMVFGSEPEIYFYADRLSASGYIYTYGLTADQAYWPTMQRQMMQEVQANQPAYVVSVDLWGSWNARSGSPQAISIGSLMSRYISNGFEETRVPQWAEPQSRYFSTGEIRVFKRKG